MGSVNNSWALILVISIFAIMVFVIGMSLVVYPFLMRKRAEYLRVKEGKFKRFSGERKFSIPRELVSCETEQLIQEPSKSKSAVINCSLEYRSRGSQLIVGIINVSPATFCHDLTMKSGNSKFYFLLYLNGDMINSPCESTKKLVEKSNDFKNELFIFTVMPYDIPNLELVIQAVLVVEAKKYIIGTLKLPLYELDQHLSVMHKSFALPVPMARLALPDCLLCLSITHCKSLLKIKIVRLHMLDEFVSDSKVTGTSLRFILDCLDNTSQVFDSTKKKYKCSLMFHETLIFEIIDLKSKYEKLKIQLLETSFINGVEVVKVCGVLEMNSESESHIFSQSWTDILDNQDMEIVQWYPIFMTS